MKSVVVEASTVAKAIELAWQKAEKPEEFFIRILQEHSSGFLGFGSKKAKIVFFFKNAQKSDSLFPVILKQKEYANLFDNDKLKAPSQINVIDNDLNKNVSLGQKKKQHPHQQAKQKQPAHQTPRQATPDAKPQFKNQVTPIKHQQVKHVQHENKTQVKIELPLKQVVKQEKVVPKELVVKKTSVQTLFVDQAATSKVAQAPKVLVSTPVVKKIVEVVTPQVISALVQSVAEVAPVVRVIPKMKRRPLVGADQGVSGITRSTNSSSLNKVSGITPRVVKDSSATQSQATVLNDQEDKSNQE